MPASSKSGCVCDATLYWPATDPSCSVLAGAAAVRCLVTGSGRCAQQYGPPMLPGRGGRGGCPPGCMQPDCRSSSAARRYRSSGVSSRRWMIRRPKRTRPERTKGLLSTPSVPQPTPQTHDLFLPLTSQTPRRRSIFRWSARSARSMSQVPPAMTAMPPTAIRMAPTTCHPRLSPL